MGLSVSRLVLFADRAMRAFLPPAVRIIIFEVRLKNMGRFKGWAMTLDMPPYGVVGIGCGKKAGLVVDGDATGKRVMMQVFQFLLCGFIPLKGKENKHLRCRKRLPHPARLPGFVARGVAAKVERKVVTVA